MTNKKVIEELELALESDRISCELYCMCCNEFEENDRLKVELEAITMYKELYEELTDKGIKSNEKLIQEIIRLKEKEKAKKFKLQGVTDKNGVFHTWNGVDGRPYELCPNCEINLCTDGMAKERKPKYCHECGQKLDWE